MMPLTPMNAVSTWKRERVSTVMAPLREPPTRLYSPPSSVWRRPGRSATAIAAPIELVSTFTASRSRCSASTSIVVPESRNTDCPSCTISAQHAAIARLASMWRAFLASLVDCGLVSIAIAPPWVRRRSPSCSRAVRSLRSVGSLTPKGCTRSASRTLPARRTRSAILRRRCSAKSVL
ncbi:hypothetical protein A5N15_11120 [Rothia kristinae]|uniref:Uncharacterized protein n=1 Tax=Rothia kristinae TaxID=37923 RepID=A0A657ITA6_9MICC|nr:hypothetical protein A5N15_11120 [Rothia kristinae]